MKSACGLTDADLDFSDAKNPTLTAAGKAKMCVTCECQQRAFDYHAVYANCTDGSEAGNVAFAKNVYDEVVACPK